MKGAMRTHVCANIDLTHMPLASIVRQYFPDASDHEAMFILWEYTGYPSFWNIPEDGANGLECLRTQLRRLAASWKAELQ